VNALLSILFLSDTYGGRIHDKPIADATPYPLPAGSRLLQDLGFLAFTLPQVAILMPAKKPRGEELTREQHRANQGLHQRRLRIEQVNSRVKRCRIVKDRIRLWKEGVRDLVMERCWALHHFRVHLTPWQPMMESGYTPLLTYPLLTLWSVGLGSERRPHLAPNGQRGRRNLMGCTHRLRPSPVA